MQFYNKVALHKCGGQYSGLVYVYFHILCNNDVIWQTGKLVYWSDLNNLLFLWWLSCFLTWFIAFAGKCVFCDLCSNEHLFLLSDYLACSDHRPVWWFPIFIVRYLIPVKLWQVQLFTWPCQPSLILCCCQDSKVAIPLRLPNNPGAAQGRAPWIQQGAATRDQPLKPRGSEKLHDLDAPSGVIKAHWLCLWLPRIRVVLRLAARRRRATQALGCSPESEHEAATSRKILIARKPRRCVKFCISGFLIAVADHRSLYR